MAAARKPAPGPLPAYLLHRWDWSESSLIVELFTRERGRMVAVAKGAKRPHSQLRAVLLPFQRLQVQLGRTPADEASEVHLLRSAEWAGGTTMPAGGALFAGFYVNELLLKLTARSDPHPALWDAYAETLRAIAAGDDEGVQAWLRAFELRLLRELGVLPDLAAVTLTLQLLQPEARYTLHPEGGLVGTAAGDAVRGAAWLRVEAALAHGSHDALREAVQAAGSALRGVLRQILAYHLGSSPLRTRTVLAGVRRLAGA